MEDTTNVAQANEPEQASGDTRPYTGYHRETIRESIADRTGELLEATANMVDNYAKPAVHGVRDPLTGEIVPFAFTRDGVKVLADSEFARFRTEPLNLTGTANLSRLDSFIDHVNRFKVDGSAIFAREANIAGENGAALTAVYDYHPDRAQPQLARHRAIYQYPLSTEMLAWREANGKPMGMADFARFLEDRINDVEVINDVETLSEATRKFIKAAGGGKTKIATPTELFTLARSLQINENSVIAEARNLSSGEGQIKFTSEHVDNDGKPVNVPNLFVVCIPVFERSAVYYRIVARLRYRKTSDGLIFTYEMFKLEQVLGDAFEDTINAVRQDTGLPVFVGTDEGTQATLNPV